MNNKERIVKVISEQGLLPLYFHKDKDISADILRSLYNAGIRVVEYTNRGPEALANFRHLRTLANKEMPGLLLGAGTIKTEDDADKFVYANADFLISPGLNEKVAEVGYKKTILYIPGCMTPSEIMRAEEFDAILIKLFPGNILGPEFLSAIKELFPKLLFIPTGGVKLEENNITAWFKAGVCAVGAGSTLINKQVTETGNYALLETSTRQALELVRRVKGIAG